VTGPQLDHGLHDELITLCKDQLGNMKSPKTVEFWPDLPRSAVGKLLK
jgi:acyl-coenzyme A synthetase/AMP-(fatty) acid ligase